MEIISSGIVAISAGVSSTGLYVIQEGNLRILNNGWAEKTGLADRGKAVVSSGGILYVCTVSSGGTATVLNGGFAQNITVENSGLFLVSSGGTAHKTLIQSGGTQIVYVDVMANSTTVMDGGVMHVSSGGYARAPIVSQGGKVHIWDNGLIDRAQIFGMVEVNTNAGVNKVSVFDGGRLSVSSDGYAYEAAVSSGGGIEVSSEGVVYYVTVNDGGLLKVYSGGKATNVVENGGYVEVVDGAAVSFASNTISGLEIASEQNATVHSGTTAKGATVNVGGGLEVYSGGKAEDVVENGGYVEVFEGASVSFASNTISGLEIASDQYATVHSGTTANCATVGPEGKLEVFSGGMLTGQMTFLEGAIVSADENAVLDFAISELGPEAGARINDLSAVQGTPVYTLTVSDTQETGVYALANDAAGFNSTISVQNASGGALGSMTVGDTIRIGDKDFTLNLDGSSLTLVVKAPEIIPTNLVGTKYRVSWKTVEAERCVVEYSMDSFLHGIQVTTTTNALDMLVLPAGTYQWRVRIEDSDQWVEGNEIHSDDIPGEPKVLQSNSDGDGDIFFATADENWEVGYYAQHVGSIDDWAGTKEIVSAGGRNRIKSFFFGSDDANILCLTDDENGDAIFVDDEFTELPEEIKTQQSRIARINEIRCGAGDDIVDMTSQRLVYNGNGLTIRGGNGNDTIWANKGENKLFGDAGNDRIVGASGNDVIVGGIGNDRMHGGGGDDIFTFCDNWGTDTVEHLADGTVTLWFASGDESKWDASSLTYTDGENSVTVKGVTTEQITLKFGDDGSDEFVVLSGLGAFLDATSELVFEESGNGLLASL